MEKVAFVILHYNVPETTRQCVASVRALKCRVIKKIVIVDNGSPDGSGRILAADYAKDPDITVILTEKNLGFAKGNNVGYQYAREQLGADLIIVTNNDILFLQKDFISKLECLQAEVVGPDIVTRSDEHQNPFREAAYTLPDIRRVMRNKRVFLLYFYLKKYLHLEQRIYILENMFEKKSKRRRASIDWEKCQYDIVLQGACLVFMPGFVKNELCAFCPDTFMYGEEDILSFICQKKGYKMMYCPEIQVLHLEGKATKERFRKSVEKEIFIYKHTLMSLKILKRMLIDK